MPSGAVLSWRREARELERVIGKLPAECYACRTPTTGVCMVCIGVFCDHCVQHQICFCNTEHGGWILQKR